MKIWLVKFPTTQYVEDVKKLARQANVKVIDEKFKAEFKPEQLAADVPKLTVKSKK